MLLRKKDIRLIQKSWLVVLLEIFVINIYRYLKKFIFADKTPRNYILLPLIDRLFPKAKKVFIKRNPLDIAFSYWSTWDVPIRELVGRGEVLTANTRDFCEGLFVLAEYFSAPDPYKFVVSYEDLVTNHPICLTAICRFFGDQL